MGGGGPQRHFSQKPMLVLDSAHAAGYSICMRAHISVTIETAVLFDLDSWREKRGGLSRGDAIAALLRLAAGGGETSANPGWNRLVDVAGLRGEDVVDAQTGQPLTLLDSETVGPRDRVGTRWEKTPEQLARDAAPDVGGGGPGAKVAEAWNSGRVLFLDAEDGQ